MSQYYQYLKLPKIDKQYLIKMKDIGLTLAEDLCKNPNKLTSVGYDHPYNRVTVSKMWAGTETRYIGHNEYTGLDHECYEYLYNLLAPYNFIDLNITMIVFVNVVEKISYIPPHCDNDRPYSINYILETGGKDVVTSFHKKFVERPAIGGEFFAPNETSKPIESVKFRPNEWHIFQASTAHSISNIEGARINLLFTMKDSIGNVRDRIPHINFNDDL